MSFFLFWAHFPNVASFFFFFFSRKRVLLQTLQIMTICSCLEKQCFFPPSDYFCFLQNFLPSLPLSLLQAPCLLPQWPRRKDKNIWKLWFIRFAEQTNTFSCSSWPPPVSGLLSSWLWREDRRRLPPTWAHCQPSAWSKYQIPYLIQTPNTIMDPGTKNHYDYGFVGFSLIEVLRFIFFCD